MLQLQSPSEQIEPLHRYIMERDTIRFQASFEAEDSSQCFPNLDCIGRVRRDEGVCSVGGCCSEQELGRSVRHDEGKVRERRVKGEGRVREG